MTTRLYCAGRPATAEQLAPAMVNYGHFTSLQVRRGAVQGLDLHLRRLQRGTVALFATELGEAAVREAMADALRQADVVDASLRITVVSPRFDFREPLASVPVDILIAVSAPVALGMPRAVRSVGYQRELPELKHVGTFGLFQQRRAAVAAGFDDALFVDAAGCFSEGTTWNLALHDGQRLLWPQAAALRGTTEALLQAGWPAAHACCPVSRTALPQMQAAFACNASGIWPLRAIDGHVLPGSQALAEQAGAVLAQMPWQPIAG